MSATELAALRKTATETQAAVQRAVRALSEQDRLSPRGQALLAWADELTEQYRSLMQADKSDVASDRD